MSCCTMACIVVHVAGEEGIGWVWLRVARAQGPCGSAEGKALPWQCGPIMRCGRAALCLFLVAAIHVRDARPRPALCRDAVLVDGG